MKKFLALFLAIVMIIGVMPVSAARVYDVDFEASFDPVEITAGADDYTVTLSASVGGDCDAVQTYRMVIDWTELGDYVTKVNLAASDYLHEKYSAYKTAIGGGYKVNKKVYSLSDTEGLIMYIPDIDGNLDAGEIMSSTFKLSGSIPAGKYTVSCMIFELNTQENTYWVDDSDKSTWITAEATLTVLNESGNLPEIPDDPKTFDIAASVTDGTGTISIPNEAVEGSTVDFTVAAATGYEINTVSVTDTTNSKSVAVSGSADDGYSFTMPSGNVQVELTFKLIEHNSHETAYAINVGSVANGSVHTNGVTEALEGDTVTLYVTPNTDYEVESVEITAQTGVAINVDGGSTQDGDAYLYTFEMPASAVTANVTFKYVQPVIPQPGDGEVASGFILTKGTVLTSNSRPLEGAVVQLVPTTGPYIGSVAAEAVTDSEGSFVLPEVSGDYAYTLQATYDTGIEKGQRVAEGFTVYSQQVNISSSADNVTGEGEVVTQALTITLYYEWDCNLDNDVERIYAGDDDEFLTPDDYYQDTVAGQTVNVYADRTGNIQSETAYYKWEVDTDGIKESIYVGGGFKAGTANDYYLYDVDHKSDTEDVMVYIAGDCTPATSDDYYDSVDVNNDGTKDVVHAGADGQIATADDWYKVGDKTIYAGEDMVAGTADDWYLLDADADGEDDQVFIGKDRLPGTADDNYKKDVNGDGQIETVYAGPDAEFATEDDHYYAKIGDETVDVIAGTDARIGTADDYYDKDVNEDGTIERVYVGDDRIPGTPDDWYAKDIDDDGEAEIIRAGADGIIGTEDDYYDKDVNDDGEVERVYVGEDRIPGTSDDWYYKDTDGDGEAEKVIAGDDGRIGTPDDYYNKDVNGDGKDEKVFVGPDRIAGTDDDYYLADPDKDGTPDKINAGEDGIIGTEDDYYEKDPDKDGDTDKVYVGPDRVPGTPDDWYAADTDNDGDDDASVRAGEDGIIGTEDDEYDKDTDKDGEEETNYVGPDGIPGTEDDWYYPMITFNAGAGRVNGSASYTVISSDIKTLPGATRSGYTFLGWSLTNGGTSVLTLEQVLALKVDTTIYAAWRVIPTTGGGGGGFGGGGFTPVTPPVVEIEEPEVPLAQVPSILNGDHIVYIFGYGDGTVGPNRNITRAEAAAIFYRLLNDEARATYETSVNSFTDVASDAWYNTAVSTLANLGVITGKGNNTFDPNGNMTRAEFATICARIGNLNANGTASFTDVDESHWAYNYIMAASENGWVNGYGDGSFNPNGQITRAEAVTILNRVLVRNYVAEESFASVEGDEDFHNWSDNSSSAWYYLAMIEAGNGHDYERETDHTEMWSELVA